MVAVVDVARHAGSKAGRERNNKYHPAQNKYCDFRCLLERNEQNSHLMWAEEKGLLYLAHGALCEDILRYLKLSPQMRQRKSCPRNYDGRPRKEGQRLKDWGTLSWSIAPCLCAGAAGPG